MSNYLLSSVADEGEIFAVVLFFFVVVCLIVFNFLEKILFCPNKNLQDSQLSFPLEAEAVRFYITICNQSLLISSPV